MIGYFIGTAVNICYNFLIHSILTFKTRRHHTRRFAFFVLFSTGSTIVQIGIVHMLTEYFGREYYLSIIAATILLLSVISFVFFKHSLFNEGPTSDKAIGEELREVRFRLKEILARILAFISIDRHVIIIIIMLAMMTRLPLLSYPNRTLFDEAIYTNYAIETINQVPFFDIHPPLARMIFAQLASNSHEWFVSTPIKTDQGFNNFPYSTLRLLIAIFGILLPLIIYGIGRMIGYRPYTALIPSLFIVFDNALTLYSRTILPDTMMLVANFAGLLLILTAMHATQKRTQLLAVIFGGLLLGAAISIKWTALGFLGLAILWLLVRRFWGYAIIVFSIALVVYCIVFYAYFTIFTKGGPIQPMIPAYSVQWINQIVYPPGDNPAAVIHFIPEFHREMLRSNSDTNITSQIMSAPGPLTWPTARASIEFWESSQKGKSIILTGNSILWFTSFFVLLFEIGWIIFSYYRYRRWQIDETETMLLIGYIANYLPFFFIGRTMFLYHYFTSLIILFILMPKVTPRIIHCVNILARDKYIGYAIATTLSVLIIVNFILLSPTTYGF